MVRRASVVLILVVGIATTSYLWLRDSATATASVDGVAADAAATGAEMRPRGFFVSPAGKPSHSGDEHAPLDLATALSATSPARAGDTIWIRGGTYPGEYVSHLHGTAANPIIVRNYNGERATIDTRNGRAAALTINGSYTWYWGLEVTSGGKLRRTPCACSDELDRGMGIRNNGVSTKVINSVIHDMSLGVSNWGTWTSNPDFEAYGNLVYYNGWQQIPPAFDGRGHGHGFYTLSKQNGATKLRDNIVQTQFSQGIRMGDDGVFNPVIEGNIAYQNGSHMWRFGSGRNIYVGGSNDQAYINGTARTYVPMRGAVIRNNYTYFATNNAEYAEGLNLGLWWPGASGEIVNNYFAGYGGGDALALGYYDTATVTACTGNVVFGHARPYVRQQCPAGANTYHASKPPENAIVVRANHYERGRAHIAVYNWQMLDPVTVDLSTINLANGQAFEVRDAMNYYGEPVARGTFSTSKRTVSLPMAALVRAPMAGEDDVTPRYRPVPHTAPEFGAFIVVPLAR